MSGHQRDDQFEKSGRLAPKLVEIDDRTAFNLQAKDSTCTSNGGQIKFAFLCPIYTGFSYRID